MLALKATHVETIGLAAGHVHVTAAPPFALPTLAVYGRIVVTRGSGGTFSTPAPALGRWWGAAAAEASRIGSASPLAFVGASPLGAAVALMLLLLTGSAFWFGSGRLADNVLSVASSSCPEGLDRG